MARFSFWYLASFHGCSKFHFGFCTANNGFCTAVKKRQFCSCNSEIFRMKCLLNDCVKKAIILLLRNFIVEFVLFSKLGIFQAITHSSKLVFELLLKCCVLIFLLKLWEGKDIRMKTSLIVKLKRNAQAAVDMFVGKSSFFEVNSSWAVDCRKKERNSLDGTVWSSLRKASIGTHG